MMEALYKYYSSDIGKRENVIHLIIMNIDLYPFHEK